MAGLAYYGDPISTNIADSPEGYRICRNAVLARTGFQTYLASELSDPIREKLESFGIKLQDVDEIDFYRSEEEVFSPAFIASLEGKPLTDEHPEELLDSETHAEHAVGHIQNVRKGSAPLKSGDMPLLGDIFITDANAVQKHKDGRRELSCGYTYDIRQDGNRILMVDMRGNHEALVPKGRAGKEVGIMDAAPQQQTREPLNMSELTKKIKKMGWLAWARDAKPEEVADAAAELEAAGESTSTAKPNGEGSTGKGADADEHPEKCKCSDCMPTGKDAMELKAARDAKAKDKQDDDEDEDLTSKEAKEALDGLRKELEEEEGEADDDVDEEDEEGEADDADLAEPVKLLQPAERPKELVATGIDSGVAVLKAMRPFVAKSKDKSLKAAFDAAAKLVNARHAKRTAKDRGYDGFVSASQRSSKSAFDSASKPGEMTDKQSADLEAVYAKFRGVPTNSVKN